MRFSLQRFIIEAEFRKPADFEVFDHNIGEGLANPRPSQNAGQLNDFQALKRCAHTSRSGRRWAGGVLRLRSLRITPSMIVIPTPGKLPWATESSMVLPGECCA